VDVSGVQQTKTRAALDFFRKSLEEQAAQAAKPARAPQAPRRTTA
jgi:hypothetical protein